MFEVQFLNHVNELVASGSEDTIPALSSEGHTEEIPVDEVHDRFNTVISSHQFPPDDNLQIQVPDNSQVLSDSSGSQNPPVLVDIPQASVQSQKVLRHSSRVSQKPSYLR
ncbi:hypothetical protein V6N13_073894 [Hibiscus sabdariffa]